MKLQERLKDLILELDRVHPEGSVDLKAWEELTEGRKLPNFVRAENGHERWFTRKALAALSDVAGIIHENDPGVSSVLELKPFRDITRRCIADLHATGALDLAVHDIDHVRDAVHEAVRNSISEVTATFTHYFPSWTLGMETEQPFIVGPVTFMTIEQWIDSVEFSTDTLQRYLNTPGESAKWKDTLREILARKGLHGEAGTATKLELATSVHHALGDCPSILKVTVSGYEFHLSRKVGEIVCKSALDGVTLQFGGRDYFYQQVLGHEHLPPIHTGMIVAMDGELLQPGGAWGPRVRIVSYPQVRDAVAKSKAYFDACGAILQALLEPDKARHPNLAKRWTTALDWFAEGQRERNDAVALSKIATSLDVLSCGGKFGGILEMLVSLLGMSADVVIVKGRRPQTLAQVVRNIYERGRSQILHGTEFDRLKSFETTRNHAAFVARVALWEAAQRLTRFTGPDENLAFRSMPE